MIMKHFKMSEFKCPCCGEYEMDPLFLNQLDFARSMCDSPFVVNSGWRCAVHNEDVGGSDTSSHLDGYAADIKCSFSGERYAILNALFAAGFKRIGIGKSFIHVDSDPSKAQAVVWLY